jgi:hypothetical protein
VSAPNETILWSAVRRHSRVVCIIARGCAGIDLQVTEADVVVRREHYPDSSTAYERARQLRSEYERVGYTVEP